MVAAKSCPEELPGQVQLPNVDLIFHYGILRDEGVLCGKLESKSNKAWVAFGAQPEGKKQMIGAHAVIALPTDKTVQQYMLNSNVNGIVSPFQCSVCSEPPFAMADSALEPWVSIYRTDLPRNVFISRFQTSPYHFPV